MKNINKIMNLSAFEAARALQDRSLTAQQYLAACLARIDERGSQVHAFAYLNREAALAKS